MLNIQLIIYNFVFNINCLENLFMSAVLEEKTFRGLREVALLGLSACALFFLLSLVTFSNEDAGWTHSGTGQSIRNSGGVAGAWLADFSLSIFGLMAFLFPVMICWHGYLVYSQSEKPSGRLVLSFLPRRSALY